MNSNQNRAKIQSLIDSYLKPIDNLSKNVSIFPARQKISRNSLANSLSPIKVDRDPAISQNLTNESRWALIQHGPYQPRNSQAHLVTNETARFRTKWFDDKRFSDWLEYSLTTNRAYCFYCRLFGNLRLHPAFSRDGVKNWRKCTASCGLKKKRLRGSNERIIIGQRCGLFQSHAMSEAHKQAYEKYLVFIEQMNHKISMKNENKE